MNYETYENVSAGCGCQLSPIARVYRSVRRLTEQQERKGESVGPLWAALDLVWSHMSADEREQVKG